MQRFNDLADFSNAEIKDLIALAARLDKNPEPRALEGKVLSLLFLSPSLRTLSSFQAAMIKLGGGFPCGAVLMPNSIATGLKAGELGTTFGGGPVACAAIKTVIEVIERDKLLANVREVSAAIRTTCVVGPVESIQGQGFLLGLRTRPKAAAVRDALLARDILAGTSADPHVLRLLPPLILSTEHVRRLATALEELTDAAL